MLWLSQWWDRKETHVEVPSRNLGSMMKSSCALEQDPGLLIPWCHPHVALSWSLSYSTPQFFQPANSSKCKVPGLSITPGSVTDPLWLVGHGPFFVADCWLTSALCPSSGPPTHCVCMQVHRLYDYRGERAWLWAWESSN